MQGIDIWVLSDTLQTAHGGRCETDLGVFSDDGLSAESKERDVCKNELTEQLPSDSVSLAVEAVTLDLSHK